MATTLLGFAGRHSPDPGVLRERFAERDQRLASDNRTPVQRLLDDPPPGRSALAHHSTAKPR